MQSLESKPGVCFSIGCSLLPHLLINSLGPHSYGYGAVPETDTVVQKRNAIPGEQAWRMFFNWLQSPTTYADKFIRPTQLWICGAPRN
jgi:hypothetical protein